MKNYIISGCLSLTALALSSTAQAAEPHDVYAGITGGYSMTNADATLTGFLPFDVEPKGWDAGLVIGYRHIMPNKVFLGIEGEYVWSNADDNLAGVLEYEKKNSYGIYFKPGYQVTDKLDVFGTLGYRWNEYEATVVGFGSDEDTLGGWTLGAGAEWHFTPMIGVSAEYQYVGLEKKSYDYGGGTTLNYDGNENVIKTALKFHF